jgi:anthraniloyl-CoA monooxygenase
LHQSVALNDAGTEWPLPYLPGRDQARRLVQKQQETIRV